MTAKSPSATALPASYRNPSELTPDERSARIERYHRDNLTAAEVKPIVQRVLRPLNAERGFRTLRGLHGFRSAAPHYFHFVTVRFDGTYRGRFTVRNGVAVDLPSTRRSRQKRRHPFLHAGLLSLRGADLDVHLWLAAR